MFSALVSVYKLISRSYISSIDINIGRFPICIVLYLIFLLITTRLLRDCYNLRSLNMISVTYNS